MHIRDFLVELLLLREIWILLQPRLFLLPFILDNIHSVVFRHLAEFCFKIVIIFKSMKSMKNHILKNILKIDYFYLKIVQKYFFRKICFFVKIFYNFFVILGMIQDLIVGLRKSFVLIRGFSPRYQREKLRCKDISSCSPCKIFQGSSSLRYCLIIAKRSLSDGLSARWPATPIFSDFYNEKIIL